MSKIEIKIKKKMLKDVLNTVYFLNTSDIYIKLFLNALNRNNYNIS